MIHCREVTKTVWYLPPPCSLCVFQVSASAVLEESEALFADMALRLEKTKAEVRSRRRRRRRTPTVTGCLDEEDQVYLCALGASAARGQ